MRIEDYDIGFLSHIAPMDMVRENPHFAWNKYLLSGNTELEVRDLSLPMPNAVGEWDMCRISVYIDSKEVVRNPHLAWCRDHLSSNKRISIDVIKTPIVDGIKEWNWYYLSQNIPISDVIENPHLPWDRDGLSRNPGLKNLWMMNIHMPHATGGWRMSNIMSSLCMEEILTNPSFLENRFYLSYNPELTASVIDRIGNTLDGYNWNIVSKRVSMDDVRRYPHFPWYRQSLSNNPGIRMDVVKMDLPNAEGEWRWDSISSIVTIDEVKRYPLETWDKYFLSHNPMITMNIRNMDLSNSTGEWDDPYIDTLVFISLWKKKRVIYPIRREPFIDIDIIVTS